MDIIGLQAFKDKHQEAIRNIIDHQYLSNNPTYIGELLNIHVSMFGSKFIVNCPSCIIDATRRVMNYKPVEVVTKKSKRKWR